MRRNLRHAYLLAVGLAVVLGGMTARAEASPFGMAPAAAFRPGFKPAWHINPYIYPPIYPGWFDPWFSPWGFYPFYPVPVPYPAVPTPTPNVFGANNDSTQTTGPINASTDLNAKNVPSNRALIRVKLPDARAAVALNGDIVDGNGSNRSLLTGELYPGVKLNYRVTANWTKDGRYTTQTRVVQVEAGKETVADFTLPARQRQ